MSEHINDPVNPGRRSVVAGLAAGTVAVAAGLPEPVRNRAAAPPGAGRSLIRRFPRNPSPG
ncbi:hypothetical protein [Casimicrobium huifangae]|uniref:hypothetical protein n=1 Tax=Casimicrobium huifangae TaxID=2591109 RepID=UPI00378372DB